MDPSFLFVAWIVMFLQQSLLRGSRAFVLTKSPTSLRGWPRRSFHRAYIAPTRQQVSLFSTSPSVQGETDVSVYDELKQLSREILRHDEMYYTSGQNPELTDEEYDALVLREQELCETHPSLLKKWQKESGLGIEATRYGGRVGFSQKKERAKRTHLQPMLSLDNVTSELQLRAWLQRIRKLLVKDNDVQESTVQILTEPKLDGLSLSLRYELENNTDYYNLEWAATRGNGREGHDVTPALQDMHVPKTIQWTHGDGSRGPDVFEVRGEIVLPTSVFESLRDSDFAFSNARNAASGILLRKTKDEKENEDDDFSKELRSKLHFYAYDMVTPDRSSIDSNALEMRETVQSFGFDVPQPTAVTTLHLHNKEENDTEWSMEDLSPMLEYYDSLLQHREGNSSNNKFIWGDYDMDGAVNKVIDLKLRSLIGTSTRSPKWAVAHKFPPQTAVTLLENVDVQVGRTGALTPVAILKPVDIQGVTVQRATLHNFWHAQHVLRGNHLPKNCTVAVRRAGDVIPQVVQRVDHDSIGSELSSAQDYISLDPPDKCPACGHDTVLDTGVSTSTSCEDSDTDGTLDRSLGQVLRCGGPPLLCPPRSVGALAHAFSRDALDISGLSEARIQQLLDADMLRVPSDLFVLVSNSTLMEELSEMEGWGLKSTGNLKRATELVATNGVSLSRFIYSLGIRHVGAFSSKLIASAYVTVDAFLSAVEDAAAVNDNLQDSSSSAFCVLTGTNETERVKGIGPVALSSLIAFGSEDQLVKAARDLAKALPVHDDDSPLMGGSSTAQDTSGKPLHGITVVFTGSLPDMTRVEAEELARKMGAKSTPKSVSKSTQLVVAGEKGGKKLEKAMDLGIRVMDPEEFIELAEEHRKSTN